MFPDLTAERWKNMARIALGQQKMVVRPVSGFLHIIVYLGFIIINIEVLEIIIDGVFGTHRIFSFMGGFYDFLIGSFEILALSGHHCRGPVLDTQECAQASTLLETGDEGMA